MARDLYEPWRMPVWLTVVLVVVGLLAVWALYDPNADIPVISHVVCSLKGQAWHDAGLFNDAGCYARLGG